MGSAGYYKAKMSVCGGNGIVFLRNALKSPIWQCRLRVPGIRGYVYRTCDTQDVDEAMAFTRELYDDLRHRAKHGLPIVQRTFRQFFEDEWLPYVEKTLSVHRWRLHKGCGRRYFVPYFGDKLLEEITEPVIDGYWDWRRDYWKVGPGSELKKIPGNVVLHPSRKTIKMEQSLLRQMFKYAKRKGYIAALPIIEANTNHNDTPVKRRPCFTSVEWEKLYAFMNEYEKGGVHSLHRYQRKMLKNFVCVMVNTGLRLNEALQLTWGDIQQTKNKRVKFLVPDATKTRRREVVANDPTVHFLLDIQTVSKYLDSHHPIFADYNGKPMDQSYKTFGKMLETAGLLKDHYGDNRTLYSCRHTYITFRLLEGVPVEDIARNCGTSVTQIKAHYDHIANEMKEDVIAQRAGDVIEQDVIDAWGMGMGKSHVQKLGGSAGCPTSQ